MLRGTVVILADVIGAVQKVDGNTYEVLCADGNLRTIRGKVTEIVNPHALALLTYNKLLERVKS